VTTHRRGRPRTSIRAWLRASTAAFLLGVSGCTSAPPASSPGTDAGSRGLVAASSGLCHALGALPDTPAAGRAFINEAHEALHRLAADPRLARPTAARVLETMQKVEADLASQPDATPLATDLAALRATADAALETLGVEVPTCDA
jgi:hypothetical protein